MQKVIQLTEQELEQAIAWYTHNDIEVEKVDFNQDIEFNLAVVTQDSNNYYLELSQSEISYRAELWGEQNA